MEKLTPFVRLLLVAEDLIMTRMVPKNTPGPIFKWLFKVPVFFYSIGLPLFGDTILLLTTTGRKSGQPRRTPLEYRREPVTGHMIVMAGWGGRTDWRRNLEADPRVRVQAGRCEFEALAAPLTEAEVASWLADAIHINPRSARTWSRWAGEPVTADNPDGLLRAARYFPSYRLTPL